MRALCSEVRQTAFNKQAPSPAMGSNVKEWKNPLPPRAPVRTVALPRARSQSGGRAPWGRRPPCQSPSSQRKPRQRSGCCAAAAQQGEQAGITGCIGRLWKGGKVVEADEGTCNGGKQQGAGGASRDNKSRSYGSKPRGIFFCAALALAQSPTCTST
eukprot:361556-Chlamydomonas_euryale.AAC.7